MKSTPGPWRATPIGASVQRERLQRGAGVVVAFIPDGSNRKADADLIAAAPDFMAACIGEFEDIPDLWYIAYMEMVLDLAESDQAFLHAGDYYPRVEAISIAREMCRNLRAAMAKGRGETPAAVIEETQVK